MQAKGAKGKRTPVMREVADEDRPAGGGPRELAPGDLGGHLHVRPVLLDVPVDDRLLMSYSGFIECLTVIDYDAGAHDIRFRGW